VPFDDFQKKTEGRRLKQNGHGKDSILYGVPKSKVGRRGNGSKPRTIWLNADLGTSPEVKQSDNTGWRKKIVRGGVLLWIFDANKMVVGENNNYSPKRKRCNYRGATRYHQPASQRRNIFG